MSELPNFPRLKRNRGREHDGDVIFKSGSGNAVVWSKRNASGHKYRNSSVIEDLAMGHYTTFHKTYFSRLYRESCLNVINASLDDTSTGCAVSQS